MTLYLVKFIFCPYYSRDKEIREGIYFVAENLLFLKSKIDKFMENEYHSNVERVATITEIANTKRENLII